MTQNFNENFNESGEKPHFIFKPNPLIERSYQIFEYQEYKKAYEPVGDYTVIDKDEDTDITEKKMINLIRIMNGKKNLIDFKSLTKTRTLYNIITRDEDSEQEKVVFRSLDGSGVSTENAILTIKKGVFHES